MVGAALLYASIGTSITYYVGRPMIAANVLQKKAEADYGFALMRLRENSEGVALIRGEEDERKGLAGFFAAVYGATKYLMRTQRRLMWLTSAYGMVGMVYPTLVASPLYFAGTMSLGGPMETGPALGQGEIRHHSFVGNFPPRAPSAGAT